MIKLCCKRVPVITVDHEKTGKIARAERERLKLSLREIARRMDFNPSYVSQLERGRANWRDEIVFHYQNALDGKPLVQFAPAEQSV